MKGLWDKDQTEIQRLLRAHLEAHREQALNNLAVCQTWDKVTYFQARIALIDELREEIINAN
jgi:hypothetical protein